MEPETIKNAVVFASEAIDASTTAFDLYDASGRVRRIFADTDKILEFLRPGVRVRELEIADGRLARLAGPDPLQEIESLPFQVSLEVERRGRTHSVPLFSRGDKPGSRPVKLPPDLFDDEYFGPRKVRFVVSVRLPDGSTKEVATIKGEIPNDALDKIRAEITPHGTLVLRAADQAIGAADLHEFIMSAGPGANLGAKTEPAAEAPASPAERGETEMAGTDPASVGVAPRPEARGEPRPANVDFLKVYGELRKMNRLQKEMGRLRAVDVIFRNAPSLAGELMRAAKLAGVDIGVSQYAALLKQSMNTMAELTYNALSDQARPIGPAEIDKVVENLIRGLGKTKANVPGGGQAPAR